MASKVKIKNNTWVYHDGKWYANIDDYSHYINKTLTCPECEALIIIGSGAWQKWTIEPNWCVDGIHKCGAKVYLVNNK